MEGASTQSGAAGPRRRWVLAALTAALGVVLALAAVEVALRVARPRWPRLNALLYAATVRTEYDDAATTPELLARSPLGYKPLGHTPGFVLNSRGFRTDEYSEAKEPGVFRVIVLGDSFTFDSYGVPIAQMWHQVAEHRLAASSGRRVEVLSLSAPAVGPRFELRLWELEGRRLDADLVVLAFFVGNDFTDEAGTPLERGVQAGLARHSMTYRLLRNLWRLHRQRVKPPVAGAEDRPQKGEERGGYELPSYAATYDPDVPSFDEADFERIERDRLRVYAGPDVERFDRLFADAAAVVERLARDVEARGASFAVMLIPDRAQIEPELRRRLLAELPPAARHLEVDRPQARLDAYLAARRIAVLDLLPAFREAPPEPALYKRRDTHWSAVGNRLAGRELAAFLTARGLGPLGSRGPLGQPSR